MSRGLRGAQIVAVQAFIMMNEMEESVSNFQIDCKLFFSGLENMKDTWHCGWPLQTIGILVRIFKFIATVSTSYLTIIRFSIYSVKVSSRSPTLYAQRMPLNMPDASLKIML